MHVPLAAAPVLLALFSGSVRAQDASPTSSEEPSGTAALEIEEQRAECFKMCYREYGNTASCPFVGEEYFMACWCTVDDWTSREEDCVWDECSPDAYNSESKTSIWIQKYGGRNPNSILSQTIISFAPECARLS